MLRRGARKRHLLARRDESNKSDYSSRLVHCVWPVDSADMTMGQREKAKQVSALMMMNLVRANPSLLWTPIQ